MKGHGGHRGIGGAASSRRRAAVTLHDAPGGRSEASRRWLRRQLNDPYVAAARESGFRSRAAFKLEQLNQKFRFLKPGLAVVDLGSAPGGWSQVAAQTVGPSGCVVACDLLPMDPVPHVLFRQGDFTDEATDVWVREALAGRAVDVVLSDMAPATTGHPSVDHARILTLAERALAFASATLAPGGAFVTKLFQGGGEQAFVTLLRTHFQTARYAKPAASRSESSEVYIVAQGFRA